MKLRIACLAVLSLFTMAAQAQNGNWKNLFNGKDLSGWKAIAGKATFEVKDGVIEGTAVHGTGNTFLVSEEMYTDFILEVDLKINHISSNSGIMARGQFDPAARNGEGLVFGYQIEADPTPRAWSGGVYDEARRGWFYTLDLNPAAKSAFKMGEWNTYRIEALGSTIRTFVNGQPIAYLVDDMTAKGFIALQVHAIYGGQKSGTRIRWRNIRIKTENLQLSPLDDTPVVNLMKNNLSEQEKAQGFELLFDGTSLSKWRGVYSEDAPNKRWSVQKGELQVDPSDGSETGNDIVTREKYAYFELVFDFKLTPGANSGVKYFVDETYHSGGKSGIGLEFQILDDERHPDAKMGVVGNRTLGSLYDLIPSVKVEKRFQKPIGEWNQGRILVLPDETVQHWLNGHKVVEYTRGSPIYQALVARSKYKDFVGFGTAKEGHILLQDHGDAVAFRNVKVRRIKTN